MNRKNTREPYTNPERLKILEYIIRTENYVSLRGNKFWIDMEKARVVDRTWQSAKQHFRTHIISNIAHFKIPTDEKRKILHGYNITAKTPYSGNATRTTKDNVEIFFSEEEETVNIEHKIKKKFVQIDESGPSTLPDLIDTENNKRKRESSSSSSSSVEIVAVYKQDTSNEPIYSKSKALKKIKYSGQDIRKFENDTSIENSNKNELVDFGVQSSSAFENNDENKENRKWLSKKDQGTGKDDIATSINNGNSNRNRVWLSRKRSNLDVIKQPKQKNIHQISFANHGSNKSNRERLDRKGPGLDVAKECKQKNIHHNPVKVDIATSTKIEINNANRKWLSKKDREFKKDTAEINKTNINSLNPNKIEKIIDEYPEVTSTNIAIVTIPEVEANKEYQELMAAESSELMINLNVIMDKADEISSSTITQISENNEICSSIAMQIIEDKEISSSSSVTQTSGENLEGPSKRKCELPKLAEENTTKVPKKAKKNRKQQKLIHCARKAGVDESLVLAEFKREKNKRRKEKLKMKKKQNQEKEDLDDKAKVLKYLDKIQQLLNIEELYSQNKISKNVYKKKYFKCLEFIDKFYNMFAPESIPNDNELMNEIGLLLHKDKEIKIEKPKTNSESAFKIEKGRKVKRLKYKQRKANKKSVNSNKDFNETTVDSDEAYIRCLLDNPDINTLTEHNIQILEVESSDKKQNTEMQNEENIDSTILGSMETTKPLNLENTKRNCVNELFDQLVELTEKPEENFNENYKEILHTKITRQENTQMECISEPNDYNFFNDLSEYDAEDDDNKLLDDVFKWVTSK